jgi:hypothetical protein
MLLNIHNEESLRICNKKFSSEWPFKVTHIGGVMKLSSNKQPIITVIIVLISNAGCRLIFKRGRSVRGTEKKDRPRLNISL